MISGIKKKFFLVKMASVVFLFSKTRNSQVTELQLFTNLKGKFNKIFLHIIK